jgi:hypothetical protein
MPRPSVLQLVSQARQSAELFDECDHALTQLNASFGVPYESSRNNLIKDLTLAETAGLDLSIFQGSDSLFKFPEFQTNIIVRVTRTPTAHTKLEKLDARIEKLEKDLKIAKIERKKLVEQLTIGGAIDLITDKITTAFSRLK